MIYIIIPVFNRLDYTKKCLQSLQSQTYSGFKIIIVDDGSTDGTGLYVEKNFPEVEIISGDGTWWWTKSTNEGIKYALNKKADYILTLNNDTIAPLDFIEKMILSIKLKPKSIIGTSAVDIKGIRIYSGERISWLGGRSIKLRNEVNSSGLNPVTHFPGRGMLIPIEVIEKVGLFDESNFPQYLADYDFTHRARRAGFSIFCNLDSKLIIFPDASGDRNNRKQKTLSNYYNHLFGITGGASVLKFVVFAWKNCPKVYLVPYLVAGLIRRFFGYWLK